MSLDDHTCTVHPTHKTNKPRLEIKKETGLTISPKLASNPPSSFFSLLSLYRMNKCQSKVKQQLSSGFPCMSFYALISQTWISPEYATSSYFTDPPHSFIDLL